MELASSNENIRYNGTGRTYAGDPGGSSFDDLGELENFNYAQTVTTEKMKSTRTAARATILEVESDLGPEIRVGGEFEMRVRIEPGQLVADDLAVQVYLGRVDERREITGGEVVPLAVDGAGGGEGLLFRGRVPCRTSGSHGITVRVLPAHEDLPRTHCMALIRWAS